MSKLKNLTGMKFGRLTVIERAENDKHGRARWLCHCDCGNEVVTNAGDLIRNHTQSCGCLQKEKASESCLKDLTGMKFGRLTVIERAENRNTKVYWVCKCDCGNEVIVTGANLLRGHTQSCGCLVKEKNSGIHIKHGMRTSKIYNVWIGIKNRCLNSSEPVYKRYGGRGITIYPAWIDDFQAFYEYVSKLENFGEEGYSLDRIDNNGNYEPNNLRWTDKKTQSRNRHNNRFVKYNGVEMTLAEAAELSGINHSTLNNRLNHGDSDLTLFRLPSNNQIKLDEVTVKQILEMYSTGNYSQKNLSDIFQISRTQIGRIVRRENWKNVE